MFPHLFPQFFLVSKYEISNYISKVLQKSADGIIIQSIKKSITHRKAIRQPARHAAVLWFISRMLVPKHAFNKVRKQVLMKSCQSVLLTLLIKQSNDLLYTYFSIPPARGSAANGLSEELFKKRTVQGGSDISALRATGRTESLWEGIYAPPLRDLTDFIRR